jgi:hypothetical protein
MAGSSQTVALYRELADLHEQQGQAQLRDRFLVLAADAALAAGKSEDAERIRAVLLQLNPHHLLQPYDSFANAAKTADVQTYLKEQRRRYPPDAAEQLLESLRRDAGDVPRLPPTLPVMNLGVKAPATEAEEEEEPPKVFPLRRDTHKRGLKPPRPQPPARTTHTPRKTALPPLRPTGPMATPLAQPIAPRQPMAYRLAPEPAPLVQKPGNEDEAREAPAGQWVATLLFVITLLGGLALAVHTFLPALR